MTNTLAQAHLHAHDERDLLAATRATQRHDPRACPAVPCPIAFDRYLDARAAGLCHQGALEIYLDALRGHPPCAADTTRTRHA